MKSVHLSWLAIGLALVSCGDASTDSAHTAADSASAEPVGTAINPMADFKFHTMIANLPSPLETFNTIRTVQMDMAGVELTDVSSATSLSTMSAKAYAYGMYITDMGFMAYQNQNQEVLTYLQTCRSLAEALGAGPVFDQTISANFEASAGDEEKFVKMMDDGFNAMDQYMVDNERFVNATEIFVGSWIEGQIIATRLLKGRPMDESNKAVYEGIYAQKKHASNLMNVLGELETDMDAEVINAVEDLMMFYAGFSGAENLNDQVLSELETKLLALKGHLMA